MGEHTAISSGLQRQGDPSIVRHLVRAGADPDLANASGRSPREVAGIIAKLAYVHSHRDSRHFPTLSGIDCETQWDIDKQGMKVLPPKWVGESLIERCRR